MKKIIFILIIFLIPISTWATLININTAGLTELDKIPEVGPTIAGRIIDYRNTNGPFKTIDEIKNVKGIGDATFAKMKDEITVDSSLSSPDKSGANNETSASSTAENNDDLSVHTGANDLSDYQNNSFKISAGRDRLATARSPIIFSAGQNKKGQTNYFKWSFGDGTSAVGQTVYHTYQFPGRYNIVLNGALDNETETATARAIVTVTEANVKITNIDLSAGFVEITNNSDDEQNLNNWSLRASEQKYIFPLDTIVSPHTSIKISLKETGLLGQGLKEITLVYPDGGVASGASLQSVTTSSNLIDLKKELVDIKQQIAERSDNGSTFSETGSQVSRDSVSGPTPKVITSKNNVITLTKAPSWFERLKQALFGG